MRCHGSSLALALAALAVLGACATVPPDRPGSELPARARYMPYLGDPIERFTWMSRLDGFEALSDSELIVFYGANVAYYLKVWAPCGTRGLRFAHAVALTSSISGTVTSGLDSVTADGANCPISEIRPLDYQRMKQDARQPRSAPPASMATPATAPPDSGSHPPQR